MHLLCLYDLPLKIFLPTKIFIRKKYLQSYRRPRDAALTLFATVDPSPVFPPHCAVLRCTEADFAPQKMVFREKGRTFLLLSTPHSDVRCVGPLYFYIIHWFLARSTLRGDDKMLLNNTEVSHRQ